MSTMKLNETHLIGIGALFFIWKSHMKNKATTSLALDSRPNQLNAEVARLLRKRPDGNNSISEEQAHYTKVSPPLIDQNEYDAYFSQNAPDGSIIPDIQSGNSPEMYDDDLGLNL